jgi:hypothetical protein
MSCAGNNPTSCTAATALTLLLLRRLLLLVLRPRICVKLVLRLHILAAAQGAKVD